MKFVIGTLILLPITLGWSSPLIGQNAADLPSRFPALVVLVDTALHSDDSFAVLRRPNVTPHDIIYLTSRATPVDLTRAVRTVMVARSRDGAVPSQVYSLRSVPNTNSEYRGEVYPWTPRVLKDLRRQEVSAAEGVGNAKHLTIWLPTGG